MRGVLTSHYQQGALAEQYSASLLRSAIGSVSSSAHNMHPNYAVHCGIFGDYARYLESARAIWKTRAIFGKYVTF